MASRPFGVMLGTVLGTVLFLEAGCVPKSGTVTTMEAGTVDPEARSVLEAAAADPDASNRRDALRALIRISSEQAGGSWGQRGRWDPSPAVQRATVEALAARQDGAALLRAMVEGPADPWARGYAALALGNDPSLLPVLETAIRQVHPEEAGGLWLAAARNGSGPALAQLEALLRSGEVPLELPFLKAIGESGLKTLVPALVEGLGKMEPELRPSAAGALLMLDPEAGKPWFVENLRAEDEDLVADSIDTLAAIPGPAATSLLSPLAARPDWLGALATGALVARGASGLNPLVPLLKQEDPDIRSDAALAAAAAWQRDSRGGERVVSLLKPMLDARNVRERLAAIQALAAHGNVDLLIPLLRDESPKVRVAAAVGMAGG